MTTSSARQKTAAWRLMGAVGALVMVCAAPVLAAAPSTRQECEAAGGRWGRFGLRQQELCDLPTPDGGQACRDARECTSACVAPKTATVGSNAEGTCYSRAILLGTCLKYVRGGVVDPPKCVD